jgi:hypothetical protein
MAKTPTPEMIATQRTVPERVLLFCLASGTSRVKAVTHATAQHMLVRNLFARSRGGGLRAHPSRSRRTGRVAEVIAGDALPPSRLRSTSASSKGGMGARGPMNGPLLGVRVRLRTRTLPNVCPAFSQACSGEAARFRLAYRRVRM